MNDQRLQLPIAVRPNRRLFTADKLDDMVQALRVQDATRSLKMLQPKDVLLASTGHIQQKYRLTIHGLDNLCRILAPGLFDTVCNVAGINCAKARPTACVSPTVAVRVLNSLIALRFDKQLKHRHLVVDVGRNMIDGVVGPLHEFFTNFDVWQLAEDFVKSEPGGAKLQFDRAILYGHHFLLRYVDPQRWCQVRAGGEYQYYFRGCLFSSQCGLDNCVRSYFCLLNKHGHAASRELAKMKYYKRTAASDRHDFLESTRSKFADKYVDNIQARLDEIRVFSLQLTPNPEDLKAKLESLYSALTPSLNKRAAKVVVDYAVAHGCSEQDEIPTTPTGVAAVLARRTTYALFRSACRHAQKLYPDRQERMEKVAFDLLEGTFNRR